MSTKPESIIELEKMIKQPLERLEHLHSWAKAKSYALDNQGRIISLNLRNTGIHTLTLSRDFYHLQRLDLTKNALQNLQFETDMPDLELLDVSYNKTEWNSLTLPTGCTKLKYVYAYHSDSKLILTYRKIGL